MTYQQTIVKFKFKFFVDMPNNYSSVVSFIQHLLLEVIMPSPTFYHYPELLMPLGPKRGTYPFMMTSTQQEIANGLMVSKDMILRQEKVHLLRQHYIERKLDVLSSDEETRYQAALRVAKKLRLLHLI